MFSRFINLPIYRQWNFIENPFKVAGVSNQVKDLILDIG